MAIDIDQIRKRLQTLQTSTSNQSKFWKPESGKQVVRMIPYNYNKDNPFVELYFHYGLGGKNYLSPISFGKSDPIVEFAEKLKSTGNKDDWTLGRKLEPKLRIYAPILVRGAESEGVKIWGFGKLVYQELLGFMADSDYGDITDLTSGRDINVELQTTQDTGKNFPKTVIRIKPDRSPASEDQNVLNLIRDNQEEIPKIFKESSYDELTEALKNWLEPNNDSKDSSGADSLPWEKEGQSGNQNQNQSQPQPESKTSTPTDVSSAFDKLFNK